MTPQEQRELKAYLFQLENSLNGIKMMLEQDDEPEQGISTEYSQPTSQSHPNDAEPNLTNIHNLLINGFGEQDLRSILYVDGFEGLRSQMARLNNLSDLANMIIDYADRKMLIPTLLAWAESKNPRRYMQFEPYWR